MASAQKTSTDFNDVKKTVENYFVGWENKDAELLTSIFHPDSKLKYINRAKHYQDVEIGNHIEEITAENTKFLPPHVRNLNTINIFSDGASAQVHLRFQSFEVMDFFSLLKVEGQWMIVNKVSVSKTLPTEVIEEH